MTGRQTCVEEAHAAGRCQVRATRDDNLPGDMARRHDQEAGMLTRTFDPFPQILGKTHCAAPLTLSAHWC